MERPGAAKCLARLAAGVVCSALAALSLPAAAGDQPAALEKRAIGYVTTDLYWALYQTPDGKSECPDGFNDYGPREIYKDLYPNNGTPRSVVGTQLDRESVIWFPQNHEDHSPYSQATGKTAIGMNLDGKIGASDFTSPSGERGIDNQLYRAIGCSRFFRGPDGTFYIFGDKYVRDFRFNRSMIEITNVDDLVNDPHVDVTIYRGLDRLMADASGNKIMPGGSQQVDSRFGKRFEYHLKGKIKDGVLTTEPADVYWAWSCFPGVPGGYEIRGLRFKLNVSGTEASGMIGGYADVDGWYTHLISCQSTHHLSYGQLYAPALYRTLHGLADGYPDKDGVMTAISSAMTIAMAQVFIVHGDQKAPSDEFERFAPRNASTGRATLGRAGDLICFFLCRAI